jgi:tRNA threonylcarbamoyladenosine biosynthesis protein TsaB
MTRRPQVTPDRWPGQDQQNMTQQIQLAIETTGRRGSVAVGTDREILASGVFATDRNHAVELLPMIDRLCRRIDAKPSDITAVYVSAGPGSFTGVRVGITVARAISLAGDVKTICVPTLDVIAQNALNGDLPPTCVGVILDAKRGMVYAARYTLEGDRYVAQDRPAERCPREFFASLPHDAGLMGEGVAFCQEAIHYSKHRVLPEDVNRARAEVVFHLGQRDLQSRSQFDRHLIRPIYVRRPEAEEKWEQRQQSMQ